MAPFEFNPVEESQDTHEETHKEQMKQPWMERVDDEPVLEEDSMVEAEQNMETEMEAEPEDVTASEPERTPEPVQATFLSPEPASEPTLATDPAPTPEPEPSRFEFDEDNIDSAKIKVVGIGGGGGNAINYMISRGLDSVEYIALNTDAQALKSNHAGHKMQIGSNITGGLGAGARPEVGKEAMEESRHEVEQLIDGADMVFITAGMGGGTGTGGAPIVASMAKRKGMLTVGIVTMPFDMEGASRKKYAIEGLTELKANCDTIIMIPNDRLLELSDEDTSMVDAFGLANSVLYNATRGISDLILLPGLINLDFADVRTTMLNGGASIMGSAAATGPERAEVAAHEAIHSPLLDGVSIRGARNVLVNISAGSTLGMRETSVATSVIQQEAGNDAEIILGTVIDDSLGDEMRVTVIATGFNEEQALFNHMNRSIQTGASSQRKPAAEPTSSTSTQTPMQGPSLYASASSNGNAQGSSHAPTQGLAHAAATTQATTQDSASAPSHTNPNQMDMKIESTDFYKGEQNLKNLDAPAIHRRDLRFSQGQHVANDEAGAFESTQTQGGTGTANPVFKTQIGNGLTPLESTTPQGNPAQDMLGKESPANGANPTNATGLSESKSSTDNFHARVGKQKIDKSNSDQPAFLRRIMD
jgi:cell division protein FtsZ